SVLSPVFTWIGNKWADMSNRMSNIYHDYIKPVIDYFGDKIENLKSRFQTAVDNIQNVWETLKGIAAKPINFMVNRVINEGLIDGFNALIDLIPFMDTTVSHVPVPGWLSDYGYATGGYTGDGHWLAPKGIVHG